MKKRKQDKVVENHRVGASRISSLYMRTFQMRTEWHEESAPRRHEAGEKDQSKDPKAGARLGYLRTVKRVEHNK